MIELFQKFGPRQGRRRQIKSLSTRQSRLDNAVVGQEYIENEKLTMLREGLEKLEARDRIILSLYRDGLSYTDMAHVIKIKKSSVGKILSRAIEKLARHIKEEN